MSLFEIFKKVVQTEKSLSVMEIKNSVIDSMSVKYHVLTQTQSFSKTYFTIVDLAETIVTDIQYCVITIIIIHLS